MLSNCPSQVAQPLGAKLNATISTWPTNGSFCACAGAASTPTKSNAIRIKLWRIVPSRNLNKRNSHHGTGYRPSVTGRKYPLQSDGIVQHQKRLQVLVRLVASGWQKGRRAHRGGRSRRAVKQQAGTRPGCAAHSSGTSGGGRGHGDVRVIGQLRKSQSDVLFAAPLGQGV